MREHAVAENPRILLGRKAFQQRRKAFQHFLEQAKKVCYRYYKPKKGKQVVTSETTLAND